jgi:hypothetical protein
MKKISSSNTVATTKGAARARMEVPRAAAFSETAGSAKAYPRATDVSISISIGKLYGSKGRNFCRTECLKMLEGLIAAGFYKFRRSAGCHGCKGIFCIKDKTNRPSEIRVISIGSILPLRWLNLAKPSEEYRNFAEIPIRSSIESTGFICKEIPGIA